MTDYNQPCLKIYTDNLGADGIGRVEGTPYDATSACYNLQGIEVSAENLTPASTSSARATSPGKYS